MQKADLAIGDLTITYDREQAVDFTTPWMNLGKILNIDMHVLKVYLVHHVYRCNM